MRRSHTASRTTPVGINLTPLIDIVFILLIFFIVTSSFVKESGVDVERPSAATAVRKEQGNIIVSITRDGEIWLDRQIVDRRTLRSHIERLYGENPEGTVVIVADRNSRTGLLVEVMDQARLAGVTKIAVAASRDEEASR
jgi:biopolymer transport protein ExbD